MSRVRYGIMGRALGGLGVVLALGGSCWGMERNQLDESHESPACVSPGVESAKNAVFFCQDMFGHALEFLHPVEVAQSCLVSKVWNRCAEKLGEDMLWAQFSQEPAALRGFFYHVPMSPRDSAGNVDADLQKKNFLRAIKFVLENFSNFNFLAVENEAMGCMRVTPKILQAFRDNWGINLDRRFSLSLVREVAANQYLGNQYLGMGIETSWLPLVDEKAVGADSLCAMLKVVYGRDVQKPEDLHKVRDLIEKLVNQGETWAEELKIRGIFSGAYGYTQDPARVLWMASQGNFAAIKTLIISKFRGSTIDQHVSTPQSPLAQILILLATFIPKEPAPVVATLPPAASSASEAAVDSDTEVASDSEDSYESDEDLEELTRTLEKLRAELAAAEQAQLRAEMAAKKAAKDFSASAAAVDSDTEVASDSEDSCNSDQALRAEMAAKQAAKDFSDLEASLEIAFLEQAALDQALRAEVAAAEQAQLRAEMAAKQAAKDFSASAAAPVGENGWESDWESD